jgi:hypothetical protein
MTRHVCPMITVRPNDRCWIGSPNEQIRHIGER